MTNIRKPLIVHDPVNDRYGSFKYISWWDQARLRNATVMVIGAGALGNEVLKNLALLGIGRLIIVDFDKVELGNLGRSVLFRAQDNGAPKAQAAAKAVRALNPDVQATALNIDITTDLGLGIVRRVDVIIGCLDNREARVHLNSLAYSLYKPWIDGAIQELLGVARVFWPGQGACYECTLTPADWSAINLRYSCSLLARERLSTGKVPTTPTAASIIAAIQVQEGLKILHGLDVQPGQGFVFNGLNNYAYTVDYPQHADCVHHDAECMDIIELQDFRSSTTTLHEMLNVARARLGSNARLELDYELVTDFHCTDCKKEETVFEPLSRLDEQAAQCPDCGQARRPLTTHTIEGHEGYLDRSLTSIGIPSGQILSARMGSEYAHFELSGDTVGIFGEE